MKNFLKILLGILLALCLIVDGVYFYFSRYVITGVHNATFVGPIDSTGKTPFVEVLYKTADNGVGVESFEVRFNNLSDIENKQVYSYGVQIFYPKPELNQIRWTSGSRYYYEERLSETPYYYNSVDSVSYSATSKLSEQVGFLVEIDGELYILQWSNSEVFLKQSGLFNWGSDWTVYNYNTFISRLYSACVSLDYGAYTNLCLDYDNFFNVLKFSEETKRFDDVVTDSDLISSITKNYIYCNIKKSAQGLINKSGSMFGCVYGNINNDVSGGFLYA